MTFHVVAMIAVISVLSCTSLPGQTNSLPVPEAAQIASAVHLVENGEYTGYEVALVGKAKAVQAIAPLERHFVTEKDSTTKSQIAAALVRLEVSDQTYWNYLSNRALVAIGSDMPNVHPSDSAGKIKGGTYTTEFLKWAELHKLSEKDAERLAFTRLQSVMIVADLHDSRAIPILRQGVISHDLFIVDVSATGLAELHDEDSVQLIIDTCRDLPAEVSQDIAISSLLLFKSPLAQEAARTYIPHDLLEKIQSESAAHQKP